MWLSAPPQRWKGSPTRSPRGLSLPWRCTPVRMVTVVGWMRRSSSSLMSPRCAIVLGGRHRKPRTARRAGTGRAAPSARRGLGQPRGARRRFRLLLPGGTVAVVGRRLLSQLDATPAILPPRYARNRSAGTLALEPESAQALGFRPQVPRPELPFWLRRSADCKLRVSRPAAAMPQPLRA